MEPPHQENVEQESCQDKDLNIMDFFDQHDMTSKVEGLVDPNFLFPSGDFLEDETLLGQQE